MTKDTDTPKAAQAAQSGAREIALPSGRTATIRKGYGKDLVQAGRLAGSDIQGDPMRLPMALVAVLVRIDGRALTFEDVLEMELPDVMKLQGEVMGGNPSLPGAISPG